eukprot:scaffold6613_cov158-Skeletonema_marinoi.AAC.7
MNNLSDLELLGQTVQCVNAALQSATTPPSPNVDTTSSSDQDQVNHYHISSFKFNPRGCVWYAALTITKANKLQVPIKVTCHAKDKSSKDVIQSGIKTTYTVTISYYEPPPSNWTTFHDNFSTVDIANKDELTNLWINYSVEVSESMEWLRRKLRRWINRSMGGMMVVALLPSVVVVLPEEDKMTKKKIGDSFGRDVVDSSLMNREKKDHRQDGRSGVDRSRSPLKKNSRGNSKRSVDPSTTKTATTCSLSSHSPSHYSPVDECDDGHVDDDASSHHLEEERRIEEVRMEMVGNDRSNGGNGGGNVVTQQTFNRFRGGLVSQHTMRRLLANDATDEEVSEEEVEEKEEEQEVVTQEVVKANRPNDDESEKVVNPAVKEAGGKTVGENSSRSLRSNSEIQAIGQFREGLVSQNTLKRLLLEEGEKDLPNNDESIKVVNPAVKEAGGESVGENRGRSRSNSNSNSVLSASQQAVGQFREGLVSQNTLKRILQEEGEKYMQQVVKAMKSEHRTDGEIRVAKAGLVSRKTMLNMRNMAEASDSSSADVNDRPRRSMSKTESDQLTSKSWEEDSQDSVERADEEEALRLSFENEAEIRQARRGLVSQHTMRRLSLQSNDPVPVRERNLDDPDPLHEDKDKPKRRRISTREIHMMRQGCASRRSILSADSQLGMKRVPSQIHVSFLDDSHSDIAEVEEEKNQQAVEIKKAAVAAAKKVVVSEDDDEDENAGMLVFSNNALEQSKKLDVLTEGQYFLGISMLVYMYSHLRETCRMGHTRCNMYDVDTHSVQSQYKGGKIKSYLSASKTAGSIIRLVIDELEDANEDDADHEIVGGESKEYERQQTAQFRKWIDDSRISQMDEETEQMLIEMKRKVARHRWRRAISAVRLSYRISGGKPPKWENPVVAPGCENCNRFVDMNEMMNETMRKQPKYFKEGSVMNNLIESGIEVVWFDDLSQNDVVYGICVNREEKKIIIAFRGTVNAHNWSMNFKFDTNEYRNPVKVNYPGREDELSLHSGFALYLLRKRKDTGLSKMDEIFEKIEQIGKEVAPDGDYKLCITGHSLGGALATLCGFYCGSKPRFAHLSTIYIWTFAAPRVGTQGRFPIYRFRCCFYIAPFTHINFYHYLFLPQPLFMHINTWKGQEEFDTPASRAPMISSR